MKGIDVSFCQSDVIDWQAVKNSGYGDFVMIRAGYGRVASQKDVRFEKHYANAKAAGIPVGAYWYSYATTPDEARLEAQVCLSIIKGKQFEFPIYFDLEEQRAFNTGKANCSAMIRAFCGELEKAGYFAGVYMSRGPFMSYTEQDIRARYALWLAEWGSRLNYSDSVGIWQFSDKGRVPGVDGYVDLDECYVDYSKVIKENGFNGFEKPVLPPSEEGIELPYVPNMTASDVQTYLNWCAEKGAGNYKDNAEDFKKFLNK